MMLLLEDKLSEIKDELYIYGNFGCLYEEDIEYGEAIDTLWDELHNFTNISIFRGVSKAAIISENSSYILKIPFNGEYVYDYDEDDNEDESEVFKNFYYANNSKNNWDYCRLELENYKEAEAAGLECFFARTLEYGTTSNGYPVYIQEKVVPSYDIWEEKIEFNSDFLSYISNNRHLLKVVYDTEWVASAIYYYGLEKFFQLLNFAENHAYMFSDLHDANYGYRLNGEPVILDFAGWFD